MRNIMISLLLLSLVLLSISSTFTSGSATDGTCEASTGGCAALMNSAFVFIKPHANTPATQALVKDALLGKGIKIIAETEISGKEIDKKKLIDQHYYAIASKATMKSPKDMPIPVDKFQDKFGESWDKVLAENRAANAVEACKRFDCSPDELNEAWRRAEEENKVVKFGGGFYCGELSINEKPKLYVFNAFFMAMRSKFVEKGASVYCYEVEWLPSTLTWASFRNDFVGPTDPQQAPKGSIRRIILERYQELGLGTQPTKGDNGIHASASPLEGLSEKVNWLGKRIGKDPFGKALLDSGVPKKTIEHWSVDPQVVLPDGDKGSIFDYLEDLDAPECLEKMIELHKLN